MCLGRTWSCLGLLVLWHRRPTLLVQTADSYRVHALQRHSHTGHYHPEKRCGRISTTVLTLLGAKEPSELDAAKTPGLQALPLPTEQGACPQECLLLSTY